MYCCVLVEMKTQSLKKESTGYIFKMYNSCTEIFEYKLNSGNLPTQPNGKENGSQVTVKAGKSRWQELLNEGFQEAEGLI